MNPVVVTAATHAPVSVAEVREHLRIDEQGEDALIAGYIAAATSWVEDYCRRALVSRTVRVRRRAFGSPRVELPPSPLASVTSVTYRDTDGDSQTLASDRYVVVTDSMVGYIEPAYGYCWPSVRGDDGSVVVEFVAGFGDADDVPIQIRQAIMLMVGQFYEFREPIVAGTIITKVPTSVEALLSTWRVPLRFG